MLIGVITGVAGAAIASESNGSEGLTEGKTNTFFERKNKVAKDRRGISWVMPWSL